jgi:hypothetical protein
MNVTNITVNSIQDLLSYSNQEVFGFLPVIFLFGLFIVGVANLTKKYNTAVSIFLTLVFELPIVVMFFLIGMLDSGAILTYILILSMSGVFAYLKKGD